MDPHARRQLAEQLATAAWIMAGFDPPEPQMNILEPRFQLGETVATPGVIQWATEQEIDLTKLMWRHHCGDWGDLSEADKATNDHALENGERILSTYQIAGRKIYILTRGNRRMTAVMLAEEY